LLQVLHQPAKCGGFDLGLLIFCHWEALPYNADANLIKDFPASPLNNVEYQSTKKHP